MVRQYFLLIDLKVTISEPMDLVSNVSNSVASFLLTVHYEWSVVFTSLVTKMGRDNATL
jgi:hypothetical protein